MYSVLFHVITIYKNKCSFENNQSIDFLVENVERMSTDEFVNHVNMKINEIMDKYNLEKHEIYKFVSGMIHRFDTLIYPYTEWSMIEDFRIIENCDQEYDIFREAIDDLLIKTIEFIKKDFEKLIVFTNRLLDEKIITITSEITDVQVRSDKVVQEIKYKVIPNPEFHN